MPASAMRSVMWFGRASRGVVALLGGCLPTVLFWLLTVAAIDRRDTARSVTPSPNPAKIPAWELGPLEVLVYVNPYFAGTIYLWLLPGAVVLVVIALWAAGVPVLTKESSVGWSTPGLPKVAGLSLAVGVFLAGPWLYAWVRVLSAPLP